MRTTLGFFASFEKAQMPFARLHTSHMKKDAATVLAENLDRLMNSRPPRPSQKAVAQKAGIDQKTVSRILSKSVSTSISAVEALARIWELKPWQMLFPDLDPKAPPVVPRTTAERRLYAQVRDAALEFAAEPPADYHDR